MILKDGVVDRLDNARVFGGIGQLRVMPPHLFAQKQPALRFYVFFPQFLASRLDREIGLAMGHNLLFGVGVLNSQLAGITG
jgi:hypothetical protein